MVVTDPHEFRGKAVNSRGPLRTEAPRTADEVASVLHEAAQAKLSVVPVGGGRAKGMGGVLDGCDVELHTSRLDRPGHTIGGLLATGWTGPLRLRFRSPRDFLIGIRVALPDGKLATGGGRVVKNVSGYDMMKLHYGALGSLGVIVAASFKVFPKPLRDVTVSSGGGWNAATHALSTQVAPTALELDSDGRVLARYTGSPDAIDRLVRELGWKAVEPSVWTVYSHRSPERWARIAVPREALRRIVQALPSGSEWWASPGTGIAHWAVNVDAGAVRDIRARVEAAGGKLVMLAAPDDFMREVGAWGTPPPTLEIMRRLKKAFDPEGVLNPGRFVV